VRSLHLPSTLALLALTAWIGGLLTLGAIVAPIVFASVPFGVAADTMARVFARYDRLAMACAAVVLGTEAWRARRGGMSKKDVARVGLSVVLAALAVVEGLWVTPTIANLHAAGVVRGVGEEGARLAATHAMAEQLGKGQALLAVFVIALHLATVRPQGTDAGAATLARSA
jgi:hypothetical protein